MLDKCPICLQSAKIVEVSVNSRMQSIDCPRCGKFNAYEDVISFNNETLDEDRFKISGYLRNQFENGNIININTESIPEILENIIIPKDPFDIIDLLLKYMARKSGYKITKGVKLEGIKDYPLLYLENQLEFEHYIGLAQELGLISHHTSEGRKLTLKGWERLQEMNKVSSKSDQAFVAMWFDKSMDDVWENGFKKALEYTGYKPIRIDKKEFNNKIDDEIISEIRKKLDY